MGRPGSNPISGVYQKLPRMLCYSGSLCQGRFEECDSISFLLMVDCEILIGSNTCVHLTSDFSLHQTSLNLPERPQYET